MGFLELQSLSIAYRDNIAVESLDLQVLEGELVSLLGPSGCGKTTTMRAIAGLVVPAAGSVHLGSADITRLPPYRRNIGLVFQSYALFPHLSVFENVAFGLRMRGLSQSEIDERVRRAVESVGLGGFERRLPAQLSGGQQQRVALARAIVVQPRLLLLDEPLSNLDAKLRLEMRAELRRMQRELGVTMLYVTHDQSEALALSDRIVIMRAGKVEQVGTPEEMFHQPRTAFAASFMGFENIFRVCEGALLSGSGGSLEFREHSLGSVTHLAWRPEAVVLGTGPFRGRVLARSFQGHTVEYLLEIAGGQLKGVSDATGAAWKEGEQLAFDLPLERAVRLSEPD
jgi:putative spermidine/putrescine transport system ATP-binding protein